MTFENYRKPKYKNITPAKKRKLWNSTECTDCGNPTEAPITGYSIGNLPIVKGDDRICEKCLKARIDQVESLKKMLREGEIEL